MLGRVLIVLAIMAVSRHAASASFNCAAAATADERTVCTDPQLSDLDSFVGIAHGQAVMTSGSSDARPVALDFLAARRRCGVSRPCIMASYVAVLGIYADLGATVRAPDWASAMTIAGGRAPLSVSLPGAVGQCVQTAVSAISPRLDFGRPPTAGDFDSGTAISFRNGGYQVSYDRVQALLRSQPGDAAVMCLIKIPAHCPAGDARGRVYAVTNLRTGESWALPDSEHSCGGA